MDFQSKIQRVGIFGVGLLGGSLGLALKEQFPNVEIIGIGRNEERLRNALDLQTIDRFTTDPSTLQSSLDLLVVCTPVRILPENLKQALPALKPNAIVTDVGSTKAVLVEQCEEVCGENYRFVGSHPMAGSHKTGVEAARHDLFDGRTCAVTPTPQTEPNALAFVQDLWKSIGMRVETLPPETHDAVVARTSHLPHLAAAALCHVVSGKGKQALPLIGGGFKDTTRIAAGDAGLWLDICLENRQEIIHALNDLVEQLSKCKDSLEREDQQAIKSYLQQAKDWKDSLET